MMELTWIDNHLTDSEGDRMHVHYLVNPQNQQCLATITDPRMGSILYVTDIRVSGTDRSWLTLEAAKHHCEAQVEMDHIKEIEEAVGKTILSQVETKAPKGETKDPSGETIAPIAETKQGDNETCPKKSKSRLSILLRFLRGHPLGSA